MRTCPKCRDNFPDGQDVCPRDGEALILTVVTLGDEDLARGVLVGEYVVEERLGQGAFGTVYRAVHPLIGKQVAIKLLSRRYSSDPLVVSRFIAEARAVNQIGHRN